MSAKAGSQESLLTSYETLGNSVHLTPSRFSGQMKTACFHTFQAVVRIKCRDQSVICERPCTFKELGPYW